jgi:catechol 2,3-dioxygenase-like lactoylglutathione lyase family enzyme
MKLEHVALTIIDQKEIGQFYKKILGFSELRNFNLQEDLVRQIFGIYKDTTVYQLQYGDVLLELFIMPERFKHVYNHICLSIPDPEKIVNRAGKHGYKFIRIRRQHSDLIFIKDRSGNLFELKGSQ